MPIRLLLLLGFMMLIGLTPALGQQTSSSNAGGDSRAKIEQETFYLINAYREASKLPPLQWDPMIANVARNHSHDMATGEIGFGHAGFHNRVVKLSAAFAGLQGAGENVFESDDPTGIARSAVAAWLKSPPHLKNIRGDYNFSGLGIWEDQKGMIYFTQIFVKLPRAAETAQAVPPTPGILSPFGLFATPSTR
ncbi:MAG TPA: CAP domain-containing protein [Candidatus Methylacidiphilales bacterium]|nr:CAP domain-containing protein [Candidatus Methylacidiphilales bacterium]